MNPVTINVLSEIWQSRSFIPEDYSRQHTEMAESKMGEGEACLNNKLKK